MFLVHNKHADMDSDENGSYNGFDTLTKALSHMEADLFKHGADAHASLIVIDQDLEEIVEVAVTGCDYYGETTLKVTDARYHLDKDGPDFVLDSSGNQIVAATRL